MGPPEALFPLELVERSMRRVGPGATHLPDHLSLEQQRRLAADSPTWPGQQITSRGATLRRHVTSVPDWVADLARQALGRGLRTAGLNDVDPARWNPDSAHVTHFAPGATLRMHQVKGGDAPVVVLAIGDACQFRLGNPQSAAGPHRNVLLESGDALVYGGVARASFVGVTRIRPGTAPAWCGLTEGGISITLTTAG